MQGVRAFPFPYFHPFHTASYFPLFAPKSYESIFSGTYKKCTAVRFNTLHTHRDNNMCIKQVESCVDYWSWQYSEIMNALYISPMYLYFPAFYNFCIEDIYIFTFTVWFKKNRMFSYLMGSQLSRFSFILISVYTLLHYYYNQYSGICISMSWVFSNASKISLFNFIW